MERVKYGVIGLGFFGEKHVETLSGLSNAKIIAVCTRRPNRLKEIGTKYNVPYIYTDYNELLANREVDAVSIVTHANARLPLTLAAIKADKHVFLEKPMAKDVGECNTIIDALKDREKFFMVGHICRFDPRYAMAKKRIDEGAIGKILSIYARRNIPASVSESVLAKISPLMGDGIHDTDLMLWFIRDKIRTVYAGTVRARNLTYPDIGWAMYRFDSGAIGVVESAWYLPDKTPYDIDSRMEIIGTDGAIYINGSDGDLVINNKDGWKSPDMVYWPNVHGYRTGALRDELSYFLDCIIYGNKPEIITPEESKQAVEIAGAAERSAATGKLITL